MSTASPLHHGHGNGSYGTNSPVPGSSGNHMASREGAAVGAAAATTVADQAARSGSVPASGSGSAPGSNSGSLYGDGHGHHAAAAHHHHSGHHAHSHASLTSPVNGSHTNSWSPYGYPSAPVYGGSPSPYGHNSHVAYSQYTNGYGYPNGGTAHHVQTAPPTPAAGATAYHSSMNGMMMHHGGQHASYSYGGGNHHLGPHTPTHSSHTGHASPYFSMNGDGTHSHVNGSSHVSSPSYTSAPQYSTQLPLAGRHRVTTTLWEDEGTLCFQVDARGVCVARRHDNNMINGTKLLNVVQMSRGKRDGILKNEKERVVVKVGAMHLKGVWISFARAKQLAEQNGIADLLYPLFEANIQSFLYHPDNYPRTAAVMAAAQERHAQRQRVPGLPSPSGNAGSQPPPLMRANTTPAAADTSAMSASMTSSASWSNSHDQSHTSAPTTAQPSPVSLQPSGAAQHLHMGLQSHGTSSPTFPSSHQGQYAVTQAQQLAARPIAGDRRHTTPMTLANISNHQSYADNTAYGATNAAAAAAATATAYNLAGGPAAAGGARKVSGLKRQWDDSEDQHGGPGNPSPSERDMQRTGSGNSAGYKFDGEGLHSPSMGGRMTKKSKSQGHPMPQQQQRMQQPVHAMSGGGMGVPIGVSSTGNGDGGQHLD
ncbi:uncharacterized protein PFL1_03612 [Pseudozyma flocculosa PF-1]|uniref:Related to ascospore maturation 1 protein n=2 Tax=Pseudozyma flocculosa TaxID=84751 RepID=A0A5C3F4W8_9BASI|nr:uncharacterized protein PFL1_03612 [Pseudozyma flocculosa PF-1]EPQ28809.1 hypothetical protein PFL1_03612 [Pseudozyma flocculosa PF-1]SPO39402.1 related to ascospore maturation 1 protein [Pseudozyma flocculosa]